MAPWAPRGWRERGTWAGGGAGAAGAGRGAQPPPRPAPDIVPAASRSRDWDTHVAAVSPGAGSSVTRVAVTHVCPPLGARSRALVTRACRSRCCHLWLGSYIFSALSSFFFLLLSGRTCGAWKFPGQGWDARHSSDTSHSGDSAGLLTAAPPGSFAPHPGVLIYVLTTFASKP